MLPADLMDAASSSLSATDLIASRLPLMVPRTEPIDDESFGDCTALGPSSCVSSFVGAVGNNSDNGGDGGLEPPNSGIHSVDGTDSLPAMLSGYKAMTFAGLISRSINVLMASSY